MEFAPHIAAALTCIALGAGFGLGPVRKFITLREAKHELRQGSASFIRGTAGWIIIAIWVAALWFAGTIIGDWARTMDLAYALDRSMLRLQIILEILAALADD